MNGRIIALNLPKWGLIMTEGMLSEWRVEVGTRLEVGTVIADIESEKIVNELVAHEAGVLRRRLVPAGGTCTVGTLIGVVSDGEVAEADIDAFVARSGHAGANAASDSTASREARIAASSATERQAMRSHSDVEIGAVYIPAGLRGSKAAQAVRATHHARALAELWGVDLTRVPASGSGGQVTKSDLLAAIVSAGGSIDAAIARVADREVPPPDPERAATPVARRLAARLNVPLHSIVLRSGAARIRRADVLAASNGAASRTSAGAGYEDRPLSATRRVIGQRLAQSKQTAPHFRLVVDVSADELLALGKAIAEKSGARISMNDLLIKAAAQALVIVDGMNIHVIGDRIRQFKDADVAFAVAAETGLLTPVVCAANRKSIVDIAAETRALSAKAREGKLTAQDIAGGTFTISNLGMFGIRQFDAIINPPQGAILAIGAAHRTRIFLDDGEEVVARLLTVTLSCDHRAIDGALGARFLQTFKRLTERPAQLGTH